MFSHLPSISTIPYINVHSARMYCTDPSCVSTLNNFLKLRIARRPYLNCHQSIFSSTDSGLMNIRAEHPINIIITMYSVADFEHKAKAHRMICVRCSGFVPLHCNLMANPCLLYACLKSFGSDYKGQESRLETQKVCKIDRTHSIQTPNTN